MFLLVGNSFSPTNDFHAQVLTTYWSQRPGVQGWAPSSLPGRATWWCRRAPSALMGPSSKSAWKRPETKHFIKVVKLFHFKCSQAFCINRTQTKKCVILFPCALWFQNNWTVWETAAHVWWSWTEWECVCIWFRNIKKDLLTQEKRVWSLYLDSNLPIGVKVNGCLYVSGQAVRMMDGIFTSNITQELKIQ